MATHRAAFLYAECDQIWRYVSREMAIEMSEMFIHLTLHLRLLWKAAISLGELPKLANCSQDDQLSFHWSVMMCLRCYPGFPIPTHYTRLLLYFRKQRHGRKRRRAPTWRSMFGRTAPLRRIFWKPCCACIHVRRTREECGRSCWDGQRCRSTKTLWPSLKTKESQRATCSSTKRQWRNY